MGERDFIRAFRQNAKAGLIGLQKADDPGRPAYCLYNKIKIV
jgi:hypothetical protein